MLVGVISDTHGFFDSRVVRHFAGVEQIIHAGDIGGQAILDRLRDLAPVTAVTGNVDWGGPLDRQVRRVEQLDLAGFRIFVTHIGDAPQQLVRRLPEPRPQIYIYGHSHIALVEQRDGVLFLNPGAAGRPRFGRRPSLALLELGTEPSARIIDL
jgi:putative phosphoesterase